MKILVITACTAEKKWDRQVDLADQLQPKDFATPGLLKLKSKKLKAYETPAAEMYTGDGHKRLMDGVKNLRDTFGPGIVDVRIISPGYGLLNEEDCIVPYNYDFSKLSINEIEQLSKKLKIHSKIECLLSCYNLAFFLLSGKYIRACKPPFDVQRPAEQIFLVSESDQDKIPSNRPHIHSVCAGERLIAKPQLDGATRYNLKGVVFERLCKVACDRRRQGFGRGFDNGNGGQPPPANPPVEREPGHQVFEKVKRNPQRMIEMVLNCNKGL